MNLLVEHSEVHDAVRIALMSAQPTNHFDSGSRIQTNSVDGRNALEMPPFHDKHVETHD